MLMVDDLRVEFRTQDGLLQAVNGVSFDLGTNDVLGIVGESGAGKSATWKATARLLDDTNAVYDANTIEFKKTDLLNASKKELRKIWGNQIGMIFQDPQAALNPTRTIGKQISEMYTTHQGQSQSQAREAAIEMMEQVGIPAPAERYSDYPNEFSGGMLQRVMIAIALSCNPDLLIADEPTTALDVTTEARILDLLKEQQRERDFSMIFITHDMGVIWEISHQVMVMYAGKCVERAPCEKLFESPTHPYTVKLLESIPRIDREYERLTTIEGRMPTFYDSVPDECSFCDRCEEKFDRCEETSPGFYAANTDQETRCFLYE